MSRSRISIIAAISKNRVLGEDGKIPWYIPGELKRFKEITTPHPILMGRKTFDSIGRVLPNRTNIVITRDLSFLHQGIVVTHSLDEAIDKACQKDPQEVFIIGGGQIYQEAFSRANRLYLTVIDKKYEGDTFFPDYSKFGKVIHQENMTSGDISYQFMILEK